jgi:uncharacterized protein YoaH (UPF0181 family)
MLILDKQKAIERIVELTAQAEAAPEALPPAVRGRAHQRVARYERSRAAIAAAKESREQAPANAGRAPSPAT